MKNSKFLVIFSRGGNALIQFLVVLFYGAHFSAPEFGQLSILMIIIGLSYGVIDFGTANTVITRRVNRFVCGKLQLLNFTIGIFIGLILLLFSFIQVGFFDFGESFFDALKYALPMFAIYSCTIVPYARLHKALRLKELAHVDFLPVFSLLITVPTFLQLGFGLSTLMISIGIQVSLRFLVLRYFYGSIIRFRLDQKLPLSTLFRQYSNNLAVYSTSKLDQVMVATFLSAGSLGIYSFLKQILNYPISLLIAIYTQITFPYFSRYKNSIGKIRWLLFKSSTILFSTIFIYFIFILALPEKIMMELVPMWGFRTELAILIMVLSFVRIATEVLSAMAIALGFVGRQLYINLTFLFLTFICGLVIPHLGLNYYLIALIASAIIISIFIYITTFNRINNGKNRSLHSL
ncbi:oligosaccharide flippase family protein [Colwellia sp. BRX8-4]|uniref:oligosaccharide flippase family protein n=1 Tax=Colwellia sp. BRX8-4 TaxID=2759836 RepID=UPI0015F3B857|nr:oligosaccharide flippase family protein [Colwellia sp. BRX8-4]MBA6363563.1 oligosaccharide flippase family protein [Colwellia sp. BRX8-8]MBA6370466.1 oligosaccharide flippase family protein [Colwellia sp. BRX8-4]